MRRVNNTYIKLWSVVGYGVTIQWPIMACSVWMIVMNLFKRPNLFLNWIVNVILTYVVLPWLIHRTETHLLTTDTSTNIGKSTRILGTYLWSIRWKSILKMLLPKFQIYFLNLVKLKDLLYFDGLSFWRLREWSFALSF